MDKTPTFLGFAKLRWKFLKYFKKYLQASFSYEISVILFNRTVNRS